MAVDDHDGRGWSVLRQHGLVDMFPKLLEIEHADRAYVDVQVHVQWLEIFKNRVVLDPFCD